MQMIAGGEGGRREFKTARYYSILQLFCNKNVSLVCLYLHVCVDKKSKIAQSQPRLYPDSLVLILTFVSCCTDSSASLNHLSTTYIP